MNIKKLIISSIAVSGLFMACAQSEFAADTGRGVASKPKPPKDDSTTDKDKNETPGDNQLVVDDSGEIKLVDVDLSITRQRDNAAFTNCVYAHIIGQPPVALSCNKDAIGNRNDLTQLNVRLKLKTNTCNQLRVYFTSSGTPGEISTATKNRVSFNASKHGNALGPGLNIKTQAARSFLIEANDNGDKMWHDVYLTVTPPANRPDLKFTIENSGIPCN